MTDNILNNKILVDNEKKVFKNIVIATFVIVVILMITIFNQKEMEKPYLETTLLFIRTFNFILSLLAWGSCLISYNRLKKDSVFVISLMYLGLCTGILFGQLDYLNFYYEKFSLSNYIIVSTSLLRILLLIVAVSPKSKIKKLIIKYKKKAIIFVVIYTIFFGFLEKHINMKINYNDNFFVLYNAFLAIVYIFIALKLFITGMKDKEYLFVVLSTSIFTLAIKAIYAIYGVNSISFFVKLTSVSITYLISLIIIGGTFIELYIYINREKILNQNLNIFKNIVDNNKHSFMILCNDNGEILYTNKKVKDYYSSLGYDNMNNLNYVFNKIVEDVNKNDEIIRCLQNDGVWRGIIKNDLDKMTVDCSVQLIETIGEEKEIAISCMDISAGISKELELEKLKVYTKERTEFMSNISHELRTPVNIFYSTIQLLDKLGSKDNVDFKLLYNKYRKTLQVNCKRMLRLINNVVDISKIETGLLKCKFDNYNLVAVVEDVALSVINYASLKSIKIEFDTNDEESISNCDPALLERAMLNLLSNAIKFSPQYSTINIDILVNEDWTEINIRDEGIGISKEDKQAIFERFVQADKSLTRENEGSGIGLSIVKSIIDLHDGYISVESEYGVGSIFKILLPNRHIDNKDCKIYDINDYNTELELSDIYEVLV
ncbi:MAG: HAMP domain-containing sensor histidine kinase [Terrisporobacter sp.]|uniref:sensor histidine kinase n=1 Tax=Terrisporobacter sp. TaxID=1965305 RepID=UPI002FC6CDFE